MYFKTLNWLAGKKYLGQEFEVRAFLRVFPVRVEKHVLCNTSFIG